MDFKKYLQMIAEAESQQDVVDDMASYGAEDLEEGEVIKGPWKGSTTDPSQVKAPAKVTSISPTNDYLMITHKVAEIIQRSGIRMSDDPADDIEKALIKLRQKPTPFLMKKIFDEMVKSGLADELGYEVDQIDEGKFKDMSIVSVNGKNVDVDTLQVDGVNPADDPDFADAYISYAEFVDSTPLSDDEMDQLGLENPELVNHLAHESLNEGAEQIQESAKDDIIKAIEAVGGKYVESEDQPGARVYWFKGTSDTNAQSVLNKIGLKNVDVIDQDGYTVVHVFKSGEAGHMRSMGYDTDAVKESKKSLKDYFEQINEQKLAESVPAGMKPMAILDPTNKSAGVGVLSSTNPAIQKLLGNLDPKDVKIVMTKTGAAPSSGTASTGGVQTGLSTGGGATAVKEEELDEKAPPGMEDMVLRLKKQYPGKPAIAYATAWKIYNKKHGKEESVEEAFGAGSTFSRSSRLDRKKSLPAISPDTDKDDRGGKITVPQKDREEIARILGNKDVKEGDIPKSGPDYGAGLGAGRNPKVLETKKVNEAMNTLEAAYHEGKSHGLSKHSYACRYNEGSEEHRRYHEGFKEGLDECYGLQPNQGLVDEADMEEGNAFTAGLARTPHGGKFSVGGKTFTDTSNYDSTLDEFAFESLEKQLNALLNEDVVTEGLSVNMSQGLGGPTGQGEDTVSVTATGDDSAKLLDFIKTVGLGGLGSSEEHSHGEETTALVPVGSDYGAPKFSGHDDMKSLLAKVTGDSEEEEGEEEEHACDECGMMEGSCGCEEVSETETPDQETDEMAEDAAADAEEAETTADEDAEAAEDASKPSSGGAVNEESDEEDEEETVEESLNEWANEAGKDGTEASFERDIEFMTKVISGGLNKPKSTGQTTIPVIAGQDSRTGDDDVAAWKKLAGLGK